MRKNIILATDAYKLTHHLQYPRGLSYLYSYGEPRVGGKYPKICFFGLNYIIAEHFLHPVTKEMIDRAERRSELTFDTKKYFNREAWEKVAKLGYLPIRIKAVPEGSMVPEGNVMFTLESTEPWFASNINALESLLLHVWYSSSVCTRAMTIKNSIKPYFDKTSMIGDSVLPFAVNDFGYRGGTGHESSAIGGAAFMVHFIGSDNLPAMELLDEYYDCEDRLKSVWATEHSVATSYGLEPVNEMDYITAQLERSEPDKIVSIVIDSKDSDNFIQNVVGHPVIKEKIKARPGRVVLRPDSGVPKVNIIKYLDMLGGIFGYYINQKTYKSLNDNIGLLQGDGMDENSIPDLYNEVTKVGWAADNFITGSGGGLLQVDINRDISRWAEKASYGEIEGRGFNIQKAPKTDSTKNSKPGILKLHKSMNNYQTMSSAELSKAQFGGYTDALETILENGKFYPQKFKDIIKRAK